ncbi:conserved serine proline-rich protein [Talaromyces stipitatus ATCC 10500]|uniref:Conserved serine proline-rich protein n=1 Tax=Talaromyces stipitatus (strain ATCC 10500 / CBS 375.48 / QM 6759 / NRRL 1006) TaxID=441959 RepID=B8M7G6_TALSN|nr:conserved serine proline-rich protein [Talaromyces stipitatus ATCC 10500]EED20386.1 conserved serine proline-rich protein [Talaromyces stipitatus ATCC 10500]
MAQKQVKLPSAHGHTAGIFADMSVDGPQIGTLVVIFDRAKNLPNRKTIGKQNPYVAARLGKEAKKTDTDMRGGQTPRWDQEIRYTVHESPDYLQLKVSVFNDDKKTDLIGETWVDLSSVIIPGGGQSDSWHELRFKNKYAGDIRLEMTYYDTRPEDEAVIERRTVVAEKPQTRSSHNAANTAPTSSSSLSGPRQPRPIKRRPLPDDPTGASSSRAPPAAPANPVASAATMAPVAPVTPVAPVAPAAPVASIAPAAPIQDFPAPVLSNTQPLHPSPDHAPVPNSHRQSDARPSSRHADIPLPRASQINQYDCNISKGNNVDPVDQRGDPYNAQARPYHDPNDDYYGEPQRQMHPPITENYGNPYEPNVYQARSSHEGVEPYSLYSNQPRPSYPDDTHYSAEPTPYVPNRHPSQAPSQEYAKNTQGDPSYPEEGSHYRYNNALIQSDPRRQSPLRQLMAPEDDRFAYASMQPTVEDENDEGLPPPPPVHRTTVNTNVRPSSSSGPPGYKPYSPQEYTPPQPDVRDSHRSTVVSPAEQDLAISMSRPSQAPSRSFYAEPSSPAVPPSLAAGYNVTNEPVNNQHAQAPERQYDHFPTNMPSREVATRVSNVPQQPPISAIQPLRSSPAPTMDRARSISPNPRPLSYRKSVSPRPPSRDERDVSSVPFSPDSFDTYNPRRSPSATRENGSLYATRDRNVASGQPPKADTDDSPIIGDDGRIIDPSDHLPSESWAPEPEKRNKKPEVIIRFKHNPQHSSHAARSSPREQQHHSAPTTPDAVIRSTARPRSTYVLQQPRQSYERHQRTATTTTYTPPRPSTRDYDRHDTYAQPQQYHAPSPAAYSTPPRRRSISPNPQPRSSPLYSYGDSGPPIPAKVPIAAPVSSGYMGGGMDALSQEMQSIDIGPGGYDSSRSVRRYAPRVSVTGGPGYR